VSPRRVFPTLTDFTTVISHRSYVIPEIQDCVSTTTLKPTFSHLLTYTGAIETT
jgi:hypothetical protein